MKINSRNLITTFLVIFGIILVFAGIDFLAHTLSEEYSVPGYYFRNKIIFGTIIGFIAYLIVRKRSLITKTLFFSGAISILLQIRYYLEGYPKDFVFLFLGIHFIILIVVSYFTFKLTNKVLI